MAGVLSFAQFIGGPDELQIKQVFPSDQSGVTYNFNRDISGWTFSADYQTIVVDAMQFRRGSGEPNFSNSHVIGTFPYAQVPEQFQPEVTDPELGFVEVYFPAGLYTGPIIPDARKNVPITIVSITWTTDDTPARVRTQRWALIQNWEPEVVAGDPTEDQDFTAL